MEGYLQSLNEQQLAAVRYDDGPSLVIAGAGSGKTRVLTNKITYLVEHGYDPNRILALTFTNKAAREMRERIAGLIGASLSMHLWMGTFHSMFLRILRHNYERIGFHSNFTIYDTSDTKSVIKQILKDMSIDVKQYPVNTVISVISNAKNALVSPSDFRAQQMQLRFNKRPLLANIYEVYMARCKASNAMDFDDILYYTNILFRDNIDVLVRYQEYFQYILVDEYQDTNFSQHLVVAQLSKLHNRVCVVGDDAQSIYSFRGATIQNILNLNKFYPDIKTFKLEQNYRSTQTILNAANSLIEKNRNQIPKRIFSENAVGERIPVLEAYSDFEESYIVANKLSEMKMLSSGSYGDFAILYRTNAQSRLLEESLRKRNIPYRIYGGLSFYQRKEIKDALGYFRMTVNPNDDESLRRIINFPPRGIGEKTLQKVRVKAAEQGVSMWNVLCARQAFALDVNASTGRKLDGFRDLILSYIEKEQSGANAGETAQFIYSTSKIVTSLYTDNTPENISRQENLNELLSAVIQFVDERKEQGINNMSMTDFLSEVSLATDQDSDDSDDVPRVMLMTVHAAKGLEFRNVFVVGVEDELFPSIHSSDTPAEVEEERRLLYVAITRAKEHCVLTCARSRYLNGQTHPCSRSRFLRDIDPSLLIMPRHESTPLFTGAGDYYSPKTKKETPKSDYTLPWNAPRQLKPIDQVSTSAPQTDFDQPELKVGMHVKHKLFGTGEIVGLSDNPAPKMIVNFDNVGEKTLLIKYAKVTIVE